MRVLVCGGRDYNRSDLVFAELDRIKPDCVIEGGALGADAAAAAWAAINKVANLQYIANWAEFGKSAGPLRNQRMLDDGMPDLVVAFPGGRGTADMVKRARAAGVEVLEIQPAPTHSERAG